MRNSIRRAWSLTPLLVIGIAGSLVSCTSFGSKGDAVPNLPKTTQEAQDTLYGYYQRTLRELPKGYVLDGSRYGNVAVIVCDDNASNPNHAPASINDWRDFHVPPGTDYSALIARVGEIWQRLGWRVEERDGFSKPNRFGRTPDGYTLDIQSSGSYFPSFGGTSPCFPGDETRFSPPPAPKVITRDGPQSSSEAPSPTR